MKPADRAEVQIIVDNVSDGLSSTQPGADSEFVFRLRGGMKRLAGGCLCCAAHGFSCLVTAWAGEEKHVILFDAGPEGDVFTRNVWRLRSKLAEVEAIVLSHGHFDHAGGLLTALDLILGANGGKQIPVYLHPGMFDERGQQLPSGAVIPLEQVPLPEEIAAHGGIPVLSREEEYIAGLFRVSGEIPRHTAFERGLPGHMRRPLGSEAWTPDPEIVDERYVALELAGKGTLVFSACSHAGLINVLSDAARSSSAPLHGVLGGFHLSGVNEAIIPQTVDALKDMQLGVIAAGHCTGWRAQAALAAAFAGKFIEPIAVGKLFRF